MSQVKPSDIIRATGSDPSKPISSKNPLGTGHILHVGREFRCSGPDAHLVMTLLDVPLDGKQVGVVPSERADEAKWELPPEQESIDPANPVCQVCQSTITA